MTKIEALIAGAAIAFCACVAALCGVASWEYERRVANLLRRDLRSRGHG